MNKLAKAGVSTVCSGAFSWLGTKIIESVAVKMAEGGISGASSLSDLYDVYETVKFMDGVHDILSFMFPIELIVGGILLIVGLAIGDTDNKNQNSSYKPPVNYNRYNYGNRTSEAGFWLCPRCRRENADYVGHCACGEKKPAKSAEPQTTAHTVYQDTSWVGNFWICPKCKTENAEYVGHCGCGEKRPPRNPKPVQTVEIQKSSAQTDTAVQSTDHNAGYVLSFCPACGEKATADGQVYCAECGYKLK